MSLHSIRLSLILLLLGTGVLLHGKMGIGSAWYFYLTALILLVTHFLFANVWSAFATLKKGNALEAELMLSKIKKSQWLARSPKAYFHFTKGMIDLQNKKLGEAELHLQEALKLGLHTPNDHALAALNIAHIHFVRKERTQARKYLQKAKSYEANDLMIMENIRKMEEVF
ncbi:MAG: tetratricopeptide (TPR) repeat protein [Saprospiraceae bacterium]|jgi:tetratricopeptide (TPR) repeat protein